MEPQLVSANTKWHPSAVDRRLRWQAVDGVGMTIWLTGLSGSGKSSVAVELERLALESGRAAYLLDGDNMRQGLNGDLGFSNADRAENIRRVSHVARLFADAGLWAIVPLISPFRESRALARDLHTAADVNFVEVFVDTPLSVCEQRDPKGLYAMARSGELSGMTGIDSPYEAPLDPEYRFTPEDGSPTEVAIELFGLLSTDSSTNN